MLEWKNDWIRGEAGEVGMKLLFATQCLADGPLESCVLVVATYVEEVQFISCASNRVCEEKYIAFEPRDLLWWISVTCAWARHCEELYAGK